MMLLCGQSNRIWHYWCGKHPGKVGILIGPSYGTKVPIDEWMPFALDNDAFSAWVNKTEWNFKAWKDMLNRVRLRAIRPLWAIVPDVVANREATIENWKKYSPELDELGWTKAFAVQDGMTPDDVPEDADVVFVGGTTEWKWRFLPMWTRHFKRVHVGRVNELRRLWICDDFGVESIDGSGWFRGTHEGRQAKQIAMWLDGIRSETPELGMEIETE